MNLRPLYVHLILEGGVIILTLAIIIFVVSADITEAYISGVVVGLGPAYLLCRRAWPKFEQFITSHPRIPRKWSEQLIGPGGFRWIPEVFAVGTILCVFTAPIERTSVTLLLGFVLGLLNSITFLYFLLMARWIFLKEISLGRSIKIFIE